MRRYEIYLIDKSIVGDYIGKEEKLYKIFKDYHNASSLGKFLLGKQIQFMTKQIPVYLLNRHLHYHLMDLPDYKIENEVHSINYNKGTSELKLVVQEDKLILESRGSFITETLLFDVFDHIGDGYDIFKGSFLAIDLENKRYGWIRQKNTVKQEKTV